jgi:hypothetical protein
MVPFILIMPDASQACELKIMQGIFKSMEASSFMGTLCAATPLFSPLAGKLK